MPRSANRKKIIDIVIVFLFFLVGFLVLLLLGTFKSHSTTHRVLFQVNASGGYAMISFKTSEETFLSSTIVTTPWREEMKLPQGTEVYLTAANPTQTGELECSISLENRIWKSMKKESPENGVACAGIIP
ncbi:MAG: hypothetical protein ABFD58_10600 [Anaerolineaceae bacterium]